MSPASGPGVSLQISLTPLDLPYAALLLPHQLGRWAGQCLETLLIWDLDPGPRYARDSAYAQRWNLCLSNLDTLRNALQQDWPQLVQLALQPDPGLKAHLSQRFFVPGTSPLPAKDFRGGAFAAYFAGLDAAANDLVLHFDADMLFNQYCLDWVWYAAEALRDDPSLLCVSPPGGPPTGLATPVRHPSFTTRGFLLDRRRLYQGLELQLRTPLEASEVMHWSPPYAELPEHLISRYMQTRGLYRLDLPGPRGCWSLHPPVPPSPDFHARLIPLLRALDSGRFPALQAGHYNLLPETLAALTE